MKKWNLFLCVLLLLFIPSFCLAYTFQWEASPLNDQVVKYRIYWRSASGEYNPAKMEEIPIDHLPDPKNPEWTLQTPFPVQSDALYFVCTAVDIYGYESDYSNEVSRLNRYPSGTDPASTDSDGDGLPDGWEVAYGIDPHDNSGDNGPDGDPDQDGWTNYDEWLNGTSPVDGTSTPAAEAPVITEATPHGNAGIDDNTRVPNDTAFYVRIEDPAGIDLTDPGSIRFTIEDGFYKPYIRDLSDTAVVSVVKLTAEANTAATDFFVVYLRTEEASLGPYAFDAPVYIRVSAINRHGVSIDPVPGFAFKIESKSSHDWAHDPNNLPDTIAMISGDPDFSDPDFSYDTGLEVISGPLAGTKIVYNSNEPLTPTFGPGAENKSPDNAVVETILNLQPPNLFSTPVKLLIPLPDHSNVNDLSIYVYKPPQGWVLACDAAGNVHPGGNGWVVPGSRVNHYNGTPSTIELKIYHFSAVLVGRLPGGTDISYPSVTGEGGGKGCFIATAAYGSVTEPRVELLRTFRDRFLLDNVWGNAFVKTYYALSPPAADYIARHDRLRALVRLGLLPIIGFGWMAIKIGLIYSLLITLLVIGGLLAGLVCFCFYLINSKLKTRSTIFTYQLGL